MTKRAACFLFDADKYSAYGDQYNQAFLMALSAADKAMETVSELLRGDIFLTSICEIVTSVEIGGTGRSHTRSHDRQLLITMFWDFLDSLRFKWHTTDDESFPNILGTHNVYALVLMTVERQISIGLDEALRVEPGYLGAIEIDLGNPIHKVLLIEHLINDAVIDSGAVLTESDYEGDHYSAFTQAEPTFLEVVLAQGELELKRPPRKPVPLSDRGQESVSRYRRKRLFSLEDRILLGLSQMEAKRSERKYKFDVHAQPEVMQARLDEMKFVKYLFDPSHKDNDGKAKFFTETLGIPASDWRYLAAQFYEGLKKAKLEELEIKEWENGFGVGFVCYLRIRGLNGHESTVKTVWMMRAGSLPTFTTAYPEHKRTVQTLVSQTGAIPQNTGSGAFYEALYLKADSDGQEAAKSCVPTPMKLVGYAVIMDGECGFAYIRIPDARRGFAKWVIKTKKGYLHYNGGAVIHADRQGTQSIDRAKAYALAFAEVLRLNGVQCSVEHRLD